jgi:hypothetical protein
MSGQTPPNLSTLDDEKRSLLPKQQHQQDSTTTPLYADSDDEDDAGETDKNDDIDYNRARRVLVCCGRFCNVLYWIVYCIFLLAAACAMLLAPLGYINLALSFARRMSSDVPPNIWDITALAGYTSALVVFFAYWCAYYVCGDSGRACSLAGRRRCAARCPMCCGCCGASGKESLDPEC